MTGCCSHPMLFIYSSLLNGRSDDSASGGRDLSEV